MLFRTQYDAHGADPSVSGSRYHQNYTSRYDEFGVLRLYPSNQDDLYDYIQSHRDSVDIHVIMDRFANGEVDVLTRAQGAYFDASDMPRNYADMLNLVISAEDYFNHLSPDLKSKFGNSFSQFLVESGGDVGAFAAKMGFVDSPTTSPASDNANGGETLES